MKNHVRKGGALMRSAALVVIALGTVSATALTAGCATYANYPAIDRDLAVNDPNIHPIPGLVRRALVRVLGDDQLHGRLPQRWALNLPKGTGRAVADRVLAETMEQAGVTGGELLSLNNETLPIYSVTRIWVRGDRSDVDIVRPVAWSGLDDRQWTLQKITLRLRGGRFKWDVVAARAWPIGATVEPELYGWPVVIASTPEDESLPQMDVKDSAISTSEADPAPVPTIAASPEPANVEPIPEPEPITPQQ